MRKMFGKDLRSECHVYLSQGYNTVQNSSSFLPKTQFVPNPDFPLQRLQCKH